MNSLQRIILIDSYMPGIVELKVDKHTNICGINASGKTTLQRLILVFYGELPSNVVPRTRDSFEKWYLPRHSSYLVFEYYNHQNQLNQVVLSASTDGRSVNYRFIESAYQLEFFISRSHEGKHEFYAMQELGRQLKMAKVNCSNLLGSMEYRAVIQQDKTLSKALSRQSEISRYARQFSLCGGGQSLRHIEKLIHAIHTKSGKMNSIKVMIAAILEEDGVQPPSTGLKTINVENWAAKSLVVEDLMQRKKEMLSLSTLDSKVNHIELQLCEDKGFLQVAIQACADKSKADASEITGVKQSVHKLETLWLNKKENLTLDIAQIGSTIDESERRLTNIETRYTEYIESNIEAVLNNLNYLDAWQRDLNNQQQQHQMLTEQHTDIEKSYQQRRASILESKGQETELASATLDKLHTEQTQLLSKNAHSQQADEKSHQQVIESLNQQQLERVTKQNATISRLESQFEYAATTESEKQESESVYTRLVESEAKRVNESGILKQLSALEQQIKTELDQCLDKYVAAGKVVSVAETLLEQTKKLRYPEDGSLLHYLRTENEQWPSHIGKVIDPKLLNRRDLKPESQALSESVFGVSLDLSVIETPEHAKNDEALRVKYTQLDEQLARDKQALLETESLVTQAKKEHEQASKNQQLSLSKVERIESQINDIKNEQALIVGRHKENLKQRKSVIKADIVVESKLLQSITADYNSSVTNAKESFQEYIRELKAAHSDLENDLENRMVMAKQRQQIIKDNANKQLKQAEKFYQDTLAERGADEQAIISCNERIKDLDKAINELIHRRQEAIDFVDWKKSNIDNLKPELLKQVDVKKLELSALNDQLSTEKSAYQRQFKSLKAELSKLTSVLDKTTKDSKDIAHIIETLNSLNLMPVVTEPAEPFASEIIFDALSEQADGIKLRINETISVRERLKERIQNFDSMINKGGSSELSEAWEKAREAATVGDALIPDPHHLVSELGEIFNNLLPQLSGTLADEGRNYSIVIKGYYDVLADIDNKISAQAAKITRHIGEELDLDGVSDSSVRIYSTVSKLNFWDDLNAFNTLYNKWRKDNFSQQPELALIESIQQVAGILSRSKNDKISIIDVLSVELRLKEGESRLVIRTDQELIDSSSQGMAYLILCKFLLAFTRMLRGNSDVTVHWPIDELGTLHVSYIKKVFDACQRNNINIVGAFPNSDTSFLKLFSNRYIMDRQTRKLTTIKSNPSLLDSKLAEHIKNSQNMEEGV